jgi:hypothetical protein
MTLCDHRRRRPSVARGDDAARAIWDQACLAPQTRRGIRYTRRRSIPSSNRPPRRVWLDWSCIPMVERDVNSPRQSDHDEGAQGLGQRLAFPGWLLDREAPVEAEEEHGGPVRRGCARRLHAGFRHGKGRREISEKRRAEIRAVQLRMRIPQVHGRSQPSHHGHACHVAVKAKD